MKGLITKCVPVLKVEGKWVRNPMIVTGQYVDDGEIVFGEYKSGAELEEARELVKKHQPDADFEMLDKEVDNIVWRFANLFPGCLIKSIDGVRMKKKYFWDIAKNANRHWLAANMSGEAFLGFGAFNSKKITGSDVIDFIKFRQNLAECKTWDLEMFAEVLAKPKK
jgi:6-oxo-cyclohex-1-ene-carbonyl-CoA hydrolase